jgi:glycosyltransferase involved in cell wall biosynthesis
VFFTAGVSLRTWDSKGLLDRETAVYRRLVERGAQVDLITYGDASDRDYEPSLAGVRVHCNRWGLRARRYAWWLPMLHARVLSRVHVVKTNQMFGADLALRCARWFRKPFIARCGFMLSEFKTREFGEGSAEARRALELEREVFSAADRIVVTTPTMAADVARRIPAVADRTTVVPNFVDAELFRPLPERRGEFDLVFVGRLAHQKNLASLLLAARDLAASVLVVGDGELRRELQAKFSDPRDRIVWIPRVEHRRLPEEVNRARIFVLPSLYEGHPKSLIEAMACGMPVLAADAPGVREIVAHGETGWLARPAVDALREALGRLLAAPDLCDRLGRAARRDASTKFGFERIVDLESETLASVRAAGRPARLAG